MKEFDRRTTQTLAHWQFHELYSADKRGRVYGFERG